jgi:hypothetical protein
MSFMSSFVDGSSCNVVGSRVCAFKDELFTVLGRNETVL